MIISIDNTGLFCYTGSLQTDVLSSWIVSKLEHQFLRLMPNLTHIQTTQRISLIVLSLVLTFTSIPTAFAAPGETVTQTTTIVDSDSAPKSATLLDQDVPLAPIRTQKVAMTAYTSSVDECDADPFIAADGTTTYDGMVAANFLPFGTKIRIPELFGDKVFVVHDRMNARYWNRVDVWMKDKKTAFKFGLQRSAKIEIIEMGDGKTLYTKRAEAKRLARLKQVEAEKAKLKLVSKK